MSRKEIWQIVKDVYKMGNSEPTTDAQIELVDTLDNYMKGLYKPVVTEAVTAATEEAAPIKPVVMVEQADGSMAPRKRGRPAKT